MTFLNIRAKFMAHLVAVDETLTKYAILRDPAGEIVVMWLGMMIICHLHTYGDDWGVVLKRHCFAMVHLN